jgi:hypothetical protein
MASILCVSFSSDFKYLLYLIGITNVGLENFKSMIATIKGSLKEKTIGCYGLINGLKLELQKTSLPDFSEKDLDLKKHKNIYADLVTQSAGDKDSSSNFDLHYMVILLELLDNFPKDKVENIKKELAEESKAKMSYGGQFVLDLAKTFLKKYILEIPKISLTPEQTEAVALVVSEYINSCALNMDFSPYLGDQMNPVFEALDKFGSKAVSTPRDSTKTEGSQKDETISLYNKEMIASSLAHLISRKINSPIDYESMVAELQRFKEDEELIKISEMFEKEQKSERLELLSIYLVDSMYFNSLKKLGTNSLQEKTQILYHLMKESDDPNFTSLTNLLEYSMIRLLFSAGTMEDILNDDEFRSHFEEYMNFDLNDLWKFMSNPNNLPIVYPLASDRSKRRQSALLRPKNQSSGSSRRTLQHCRPRRTYRFHERQLPEVPYWSARVLGGIKL